MQRPKQSKAARRTAQKALTVMGSVALTTLFFLILPLIQAIHQPPSTDLLLQEVATAKLPPPPPPPEEEEKPDEEEPEDAPPELSEEAPPLDLAQLELALNPGFGSGFGTDFGVKLQTLTPSKKEDDALFSLADLDQKPRIVYQPSPAMNASVRRSAPGTVYILFVVSEDGRVMEPKIQKSSDSIFEKPALDAIRKWRFEPGKRKGKPVQFKMRVPITFPKR